MKKTLLFVALVAVGASLYWFSGPPPPPPDGPFESYQDNGQLEWKGTYKDGEECGEWIELGETVTYDPC
jgi:hypothetical protein